MTSRDRIVILVIGVVVLLAGYWMLALGPKRKEATKLGKDLTAAHQRLAQARTALQEGQAAQASYAGNYAAVARLGKAVPSDDDVPSLVYQLDHTANATGVDFLSVKLTSGQGSPPAATTASSAAAAANNSGKSASGGSSSGSGTSGSSGSGSAGSSSGSGTSGSQGSSGAGGATATPASSPAQPTQSATASLPPGAVVGPAGLSTMPFSFAFTGSFFRLSDFFARLEQYITPRQGAIDVSGRLLLVNGISLSADQNGFPHMKAAIAATAYLVPPAEGTFNGATPQGPAGGSAGAQPTGASGSPATPPAPAVVKP